MTNFKIQVSVDNTVVAEIDFNGAVHGESVGYDIDSVNYEFRDFKEFRYKKHMKELLWILDSILDDVLEEVDA